MEIADEIDDLDSMPLVKRKRLLLSEKEPPLRHPSVKRVTPAVKQKWPGLPRGVIFDPSDEDLLWHLLAEIGKGEIEPHPLISEFIATLDDNDSFAYCHPYTLPGVKQDGKVSYYFHKSFKAYDMRSRKRKKSLNEDTGLWHQVGKTKPLYMDGIQRGFKRIMVLYMRMACGEKPEKTNWVMHQFSASREDEGGEFVVSKIFYQAKCRPDDGSAVGLPIDIVKYVAGEVGNIVSQKAVRPDFHAGKSSFTSLDVPVQSRYDDIQAEESHPHAGWSEADNNDKFSRNPTEDSKQGENQLQFLLDGQQHGNMLAFGELFNRQSVCALEVETGRPCLSDNAHLGDDDVGKKVDYKAGTSSRSSLDIREDINECVADQVKNESEPIVTQPLHDECYVDTGEHDVAKSSASALIESTETVISGGELGSLIAKAEAQNSVCSTLLVPVKTEPMDQIYVTSVSETNAATEYCSNMSIASLIPSIAPSILEANVCLSDTSSSRYNFHQNNKKDSGHVISEAKQCCLEQVHVNQNVYDPHTSSHVSILPFEVKAELVEELPSLLIAADYPTETSSDFALCSSEVNPQDNNSQDNLLLADRTSVEHASANCSVLNQASDSKDVLSNSNDLQCSTTTSGPLDTVNSESSCIIKCCATKVPIREIDFEARNKLPDLVPSSYPERSKLECVESRLVSADQSSPSILSELDVQRTMVKSEFFEEPATDVIDHIPLIVRMHATGISSSSLANNMESSLQLALPSRGCDSFDSANVKAKCFSLRRKNKKTATDSVETALEEDVPGLLQVLLDRGITVEEIKLYGDAEDDEAIALDSEDSFKDLEAVITKLFSNGPSILKLSMIRPIKGSKAVYCLACLISLIEQTRYLRFRQNPIEWGWCRDLQSFIFVFESHNRIVLERPEYGYATYFFELVATLPIDWQIKRLVTAMKLPFCSRSLLIENKSLLVGKDITEGEARVLEEYGWIRNSGIGSLLNYCDRVVHDKRSETYSSEWRGKIGKMLMRGYDSGRTILCSLPKKVTGKYIGYQNPEQYIGDQNPEQYTDYCNPEIKLEPFVD